MDWFDRCRGRSGIAASILVAATSLYAAAVRAEVDHIEIISREAVPDPNAKPDVAPYEAISGRAWFTLDPNAPANSAIVDLKKAPRNAKGRVEFASDFRLIRPVHPVDSTLLYDVNNRGHMITRGLNFAADPAGEKPGIDNGFLQRNGFTVLSSAWAWDVVPESPQDHPLVLTPPIATDHGSAATGFEWAFDRFQGSFRPFARTEAERLAAGDPRPSLEARYGSRPAFVSQVQAVGERAVAAHRLLAEDLPGILVGEGDFWDRIMLHDPAEQSCGYLHATFAER